MKIRNEKDFWSGVMFIAFGLFFVVFAQQYDFGTSRRMGPAYFPTILGAILLAIGALVAITGLGRSAQGGKVEKFYFKEIAFVLGAIVAYGLILRTAGLLVSIVVLIVISMLGSHEFKWKEAAILSVVMGALVYVVFVVGLSLTIPVLPKFLDK
jgi:hypothetical protein